MEELLICECNEFMRYLIKRDLLLCKIDNYDDNEEYNWYHINEENYDKFETRLKHLNLCIVGIKKFNKL